MIFGRQVIGKVLDGTKTMTRRRHGDRHIHYQAGKVYAIQPGRGQFHIGHVLVRDVRVERLGDITIADADREGFLNRGEFFFYWEQVNGTPKMDEPVAVIRFELAAPCPNCARWEP